MDYSFALKIPPNTSINNLVSVTFTLPRGRIIEIRINIPEGCMGLAHVRIIHNEVVLWPTSPDEWYEGDGVQIVIRENYELPESWNLFTVEGYNEDEAYSHTITVAFTIASKRIIPDFLWKFLETLRITATE